MSTGRHWQAQAIPIYLPSLPISSPILSKSDNSRSFLPFSSHILANLTVKPRRVAKPQWQYTAILDHFHPFQALFFGH